MDTRRAGILVFPFLGYSLLMVVPPLLLDDLLVVVDVGELPRRDLVRVLCDLCDLVGELKLSRLLRVRTTSRS